MAGRVHAPGGGANVLAAPLGIGEQRVELGQGLRQRKRVHKRPVFERGRGEEIQDAAGVAHAYARFDQVGGRSRRLRLGERDVERADDPGLQPRTRIADPLVLHPQRAVQHVDGALGADHVVVRARDVEKQRVLEVAQQRLALRGRRSRRAQDGHVAHRTHEHVAFDRRVHARRSREEPSSSSRRAVVSRHV